MRFDWWYGYACVYFIQDDDDDDVDTNELVCTTNGNLSCIQVIASAQFAAIGSAIVSLHSYVAV